MPGSRNPSQWTVDNKGSPPAISTLQESGGGSRATSAHISGSPESRRHDGYASSPIPSKFTADALSFSLILRVRLFSRSCYGFAFPANLFKVYGLSEYQSPSMA